jgi:hypothetical protein
MPDKHGRFSQQEAAFIDFMVSSSDPVYAAEKAGYGSPKQRASDLCKRPEVQAAVRAAVLARVNTEGVSVAAGTLISIAKDETAPKNSRVAAARALAEMTHLGGIDGLGVDKPLSEMTRLELSEARDRAVAYLAELERPTLELTAAEVLAGGLFD